MYSHSEGLNGERYLIVTIDSTCTQIEKCKMYMYSQCTYSKVI